MSLLFVLQTWWFGTKKRLPNSVFQKIKYDIPLHLHTHALPSFEVLLTPHWEQVLSRLSIIDPRKYRVHDRFARRTNLGRLNDYLKYVRTSASNLSRAGPSNQGLFSLLMNLRTRKGLDNRRGDDASFDVLPSTKPSVLQIDNPLETYLGWRFQLNVVFPHSRYRTKLNMIFNSQY